MKVCVVGTGYVGLVTGTCLAEMGNTVWCVDNNADKITQLQQGHIPIYEPGLEELVETNTREGRLQFTTELTTAVQLADICMIAVGTPQGDDGSADLSAVEAVAKAIIQASNGYKVLVTKSTVPVGTGDKLTALLTPLSAHPFSVVSNPEFLKQGAAVDDFLRPDRIVIGANDDRAAEVMRELYAPFLRTGNPIILMDIRSSEMTKYVANAFLATKISFMNEMSALCQRVGADITQVRTGICSDTRIGSQFMFPGVGFGGSCFPKDVKALIATSQEHGLEPHILQAVDSRNQQQWQDFVAAILAHYQGNVSGLTFAMWGLAFKPRTDDMREAPSEKIIRALVAHGAKIRAFDPKAMDVARAVFLADISPETLQYTTGAYEAASGADALLLVTEWNEFRRPDWERLAQALTQPVVFDGRNQYEPQRMAQRGFQYYSIGRPST